MDQTSAKKISDVFCENISCKKLICRTDQEWIYYAGLVAQPKITGSANRRHVFVECPFCGWVKKINLIKPKTAVAKTSGGKFSIFRRRF